MKVGIVSIFDNNNYGNRLQNYALQQTLLKNAEEIVTIKNKPYFSEKSRLARMLPFAESVALNRLLGMNRRAQMVSFTRKHIPISRNCYWYDKGTPYLKKEDRCSLYCAGSDQVWNPNCGRVEAFNYLGFADRERTFSYAASFGIDRIPKEFHEDMRKGLQHIKYISVREDAGKQIVEELTGRNDVQVLVDPTMLLTTDEWDAVADPPKGKLPEKYILTYFLGKVSQERRNSINTRAKEMNCEIIELMDRNSPFYAVGPGEFVYLIKHAALVCTDSFHGSVFSFLYGRPMIIMDRQGSGDNMGSRLETLADKFSLRCCIAGDGALPELPAEPDYSAGYAALEEERKKAKAFLDMVFQEAERAGLCD